MLKNWKYRSGEPEKIEKVMDVFKDYIHKHDELDILYSEKVGYVFLGIDPKNKELLDATPIENAEQLAEQLAFEKGLQTLFALRGRQDSDFVTKEELAAIEQQLISDFAGLPEYQH